MQPTCELADCGGDAAADAPAKSPDLGHRHADEELMLRRLKAHEDALRAMLPRVLELRAAAHRCCCGIGLLECCCALLRSGCAQDEEELLRYCADARHKMAPFAGLVRAMLMAMPTPVVERCAGCRGGMMVLMRDSG